MPGNLLRNSVFKCSVQSPSIILIVDKLKSTPIFHVLIIKYDLLMLRQNFVTPMTSRVSLESVTDNRLSMVQSQTTDNTPVSVDIVHGVILNRTWTLLLA